MMMTKEEVLCERHILYNTTIVKISHTDPQDIEQLSPGNDATSQLQ